MAHPKFKVTFRHYFLRAESPISTQLAVRVAHENACCMRAESPMSAQPMATPWEKLSY
ncbi:MAG: hypothetical protein KHX42_03920 [Prevotella sp.]|nr:hypothetical protein [Prevotella sp.]